MSGRAPWQYSEALGGEYLYLIEQDEIVLRSGRRFRRPAHIPRSELNAAAIGNDKYRFIFDEKAGEGGAYTTSGGSSQTQATGSVPRSGYTQYSTSPPTASGSALPSDLATRFGNLSVSGGSARTNPSATSSQQTTQQQPRVAFARDPVRGGLKANVVTNLRDVPGSRTTEVTGSEVVGAGGDTETLFPQYRTRPKRFFFVGKVFSMLWSEPAGMSHATQVTNLEEGISIGPYGERVYSKIRRFVVIRASDTYCNALPISTYGGRGVGKRGVIKSEHAIIFTGQRAPDKLDIEQARRGEMPMRNTPIRVDPDNREDILDPKSRLNFGHPHTIQHNIKAKSCGKVPQEHVDNMILQFADVFGIVSSGGTLRQRRDQEEEEEEEEDDDDSEDDNRRKDKSRRRNDDDDDADDTRGHHDDEGDGRASEDDDDDDENVEQLRTAMASMLSRGANPEDVLRTTLSSLVRRGLDQDDAKTLIRKAYKPS